MVSSATAMAAATATATTVAAAAEALVMSMGAATTTGARRTAAAAVGRTTTATATAARSALGAIVGLGAAACGRRYTTRDRHRCTGPRTVTRRRVTRMSRLEAATSWARGRHATSGNPRADRPTTTRRHDAPCIRRDRRRTPSSLREHRTAPHGTIADETAVRRQAGTREHGA